MKERKKGVKMKSRIGMESILDQLIAFNDYVRKKNIINNTKLLMIIMFQMCER